MSEEIKKENPDNEACKSEKAEIEEKSNGDGDVKSPKSEKKAKKECERLEKELAAVKKELEQKEEFIKAQNEKYLRVLAEYDNYRKRTQTEKEGIYSDACQHVINSILPVIDSLEMALAYGNDSEGVVKGVSMTLSAFTSCLEKLGVSEIECEKFDPTFHDAVMHIEDEQLGDGAIVQVLRKGYKKGDKVIRHAMVKVAN